MSKVQLKEEAKSLLLKGCYKMAFNKYKRLIEMGAEGFTQREWAVIHLNQGICLQFQEQYQQALEIKRAIQIDPKYDKAYYRKIQLLRELGKFEQLLEGVPVWINNKEIQQLLSEIREEYLNSLGLDQIIEALLQGKTTKEQTKESHAKFYQRMTEHLEGQKKEEAFLILGQKINQYYLQLIQLGQKDVIQSFLSILHLLILKQKENPKLGQSITALLSSFWVSFAKYGQPFRAKTVAEHDITKNQQYKLAKYSPFSEELLHLIRISLLNSDIQNKLIFQNTVQMISMIPSNKPQFNHPMLVLVSDFINKVTSNLTHQTLPFFKRSIFLIDALVRANFQLGAQFSFPSVDVISLFYLRYYLLNNPSPNFHQNTHFKHCSCQQIIDFLSNNLQNFAVIFLCQQFIHKLDKQMTKSMLVAIEQQLSLMRQLKQMDKDNSRKARKRLTQMSKQYELIYTSLMLKIDLKHSVPKINMQSLLGHKHNTAIYNHTLSDITINTFLLLAMSNKQHLIEVLNHPNTITTVLQQFIDNSVIEQVESLGIVVTFVYLLTIDLQLQQEENYAKQMGVTVQEIKKAKKIQGEQQESQLAFELTKQRTKFKQYMCKHWSELIPNFSSLLINLHEQGCLSKWGKVLCGIAEIDCSRFHHPKIIQIMLLVFKYDKATAGKFFSLLCKKINTALLKFEIIQSISNVLEYNIENGQHELVIFQSLLGLINLSSNLTTRLKLSVPKLINCLFEENRYIMHAACELLNNVLIYEEKEEINKLEKLKQIVEKYIAYFREQIGKQHELPFSDYSHPAKIYPTLLSLAIVIDMDYLHEFKDWSTLEEYLLKLKGPKGVTLFKSVMYMKMKNRLPVSWWHKFSKDLTEFQNSDGARWAKLKQYIK